MPDLTNGKPVKTKTCANCDADFDLTDKHLEFYNHIKVPEPTWCPECRHIRRHGFINDYVFYLRKCDNCQTSFVSTFPPNSEYKVFCHDCWFDEKRDDKAEGREYDPNRSFFEQFDELLHAAPQLGIIGMQNTNSEYCESIANCKNCYLISECSNCEDCMHSYWIQRTKDSIDLAYTDHCERCYECTDCIGCFKLQHGRQSNHCKDSYFLDNCSNCTNCLFCTNLRHKQYYIFNKPHTKEEYEKLLAELKLNDWQAAQSAKQKFEDFLKTQPRKHLQIEKTENCMGNHIYNAENCYQVFHCYDAEDCAYGEHGWRDARDCMDSNSAGRSAELLYETTNSGIGSYNVKFSRYCWGSKDTEYCNQCKNGRNLFGCASLQPGARYCILNHQYTKEEYEALTKQIHQKMLEDKEYGEFFPLAISIFGYNNTLSYEDHPYTKEEVIKKGWKWENQESGTRNKGDEKKGILTCELCQKNYQPIPKELKFYKSENLPIPRECPHCRHKQRLKIYGGRNLHQTACTKCNAKIETTYDPKEFPQIYCRECYLGEVY